MTDCSSLLNEPPLVKQFDRGQIILALCKKVWVLSFTARRVNDATQDRVDWSGLRLCTRFAEWAIRQIRGPRGGQTARASSCTRRPTSGV